MAHHAHLPVSWCATPTGSGHVVTLRASEVSYSWEASRQGLQSSQGWSWPHPGLSPKAASAWGDATGRGYASVPTDGVQASAALGPSRCFQANAQQGSQGTPRQVQTGVQRFQWAWGARVRLQGPGSSDRFEVPALCSFFFWRHHCMPCEILVSRPGIETHLPPSPHPLPQSPNHWITGEFPLLDMGLGRLRQLVMDREAWRVAVHGVDKCPDFTKQTPV